MCGSTSSKLHLSQKKTKSDSRKAETNENIHFFAVIAAGAAVLNHDVEHVGGERVRLMFNFPPSSLPVKMHAAAQMRMIVNPMTKNVANEHALAAYK